MHLNICVKMDVVPHDPFVMKYNVPHYKKTRTINNKC